MRLYQQERLLGRKSLSPLAQPSPYQDSDTLLANIPDRFRPYGKSIIELIKSHPDIVGWDKDHRIKLKGIIIPESDLGKTLQYFFKNVVVTRSSDVPPGTYELLEALHNELGMPKSWVQNKLTTRQSIRSKKKKSSDKMWVAY
jgi:hypothetical protein